MTLPNGLAGILETLAASAWRQRTEPHVHKLARKLTDNETKRSLKMHLIIDELHRRCVYSPDPVKETLGPLSPDVFLPNKERIPIDSDEACLFVATMAMSVGIPCRFVLARYDRALWTCFVAYETEDGLWQNVNPLRQKIDRVPNELVMGPIPVRDHG